MIGLLMLAVVTIPGGFDTGNSLLRTCQEPSMELACIGYVSGVYDADRASGQGVCAASAERKQLADIVVKYLTDHPEVRQYNAALLVHSALLNTFPCPK